MSVLVAKKPPAEAESAFLVNLVPFGSGTDSIQSATGS